MGNMADRARFEGFTVNEHGIIEDLGKFEAEHVSTLYFYDVLQNGDFGDIDYEDPENGETVYLITKRDCIDADLPEDAAGKYFHLWCRSDGFVCGSVVEKDDLVPVSCEETINI